MCGIVGIYGNKKASYLTYLALYALQHRGQESAGIVTSDGEGLHQHKGMGLVSEVFDEKSLKALKGSIAIGHVRYSTTGSSLLKNAQPLDVEYSRGGLAMAHNGNIVNAYLLHDELEAYGSIFQTTLDSEIIIHLMAQDIHKPRTEALSDALKHLKGAYSLVVMTEDTLMGVRDPYGWRPLCIGNLRGAHVLASETCALDLIGAKFVREIKPGELVVINRHGLLSRMHSAQKENAHCIFEHIYFARPDSVIFGDNVHTVRMNLGRQLAVEHPAKADLVMAIPDSGNSAALGFSQESGIPLQIGLTRNHYIGRTFIQPSQLVRDLNVKIKFNPLKNVLRGKRIVVVDDSIVRGTTSRKRMRNLREAGAKEIHLRISCPPIRHACFYGIDFPNENELIANKKRVDRIARFLDVDTLGYVSIKGMLKCVTGKPRDYCTACFSGRYPVPLPKGVDKNVMEQRKCCGVEAQ